MVGRRCDGCRAMWDTVGWRWLWLSNTNYPNGGFWMRFHGNLCLRRWLDIAAGRVHDPGPATQPWAFCPGLGIPATLARFDGDQRLRFPAHGAHFGRRGGA